MEAELLVILMFIGVLVGIFIGFPLAFTLMGMALVFGYAALGDVVFDLMASRCFSCMTNYIYVAIPLFVFMGCMLESSGIANKAFNVLNQWLRKFRGGLAIATILLCTIFAACTGIVGAAVTTMGLLVLEPMISRGYDKGVATGVVAAGGTLGILIPPSVMLVLFAPLAKVSLVDLFAAAIPPGLLLAALYCLYIVFLAIFKKNMLPDPMLEYNEGVKLITLREGLLSFVPFLLLILFVMGAIFFGIAAPTEAAAIGAFGSIILAAANKKCTKEALKEAAVNTMRTTTMVLFIAAGANMFTSVFFGIGGNRVVANFLLNLGVSSYGALAIMLVIIFLLGALIDWVGILLIVVPIFLPILVEVYGLDLLWVSMLIIVLLQTSFLTPPFAYSLFYVKSVSPEGVTIKDIYKGVVPFILLQLVCLLLCIILPGLITFLPSL